jgi:hypothetical protein
MKIIIFLLLSINSVSQTNGYVLMNADGTLKIPDNSLSISKVSTLQTALNTKMNIWYAADAQANDSYVITLSPVPASYTTGMMIVFKANTANTTGATLNVNSLGVKNIVKRVSTTLATGDILQGMLCWLVYDGVNFCLLNPIVN